MDLGSDLIGGGMTDIRWLIEIVEKESGTVVKTMGPETQHTANRVKRGVGINLDRERFSVRVVPDRAPVRNKRR